MVDSYWLFFCFLIGVLFKNFPLLGWRLLLTTRWEDLEFGVGSHGERLGLGARTSEREAQSGE